MAILPRLINVILVDCSATMLTKVSKSRLSDRCPITVAAAEDKVRLQCKRRLVDSKTHLLLNGVALTIRKIG